MLILVASPAARCLLLAAERKEALLEGDIEGADGALLLPRSLQVVDSSPGKIIMLVFR